MGSNGNVVAFGLVVGAVVGAVVVVVVVVVVAVIVVGGCGVVVVDFVVVDVEDDAVVDGRSVDVVVVEGFVVVPSMLLLDISFFVVGCFVEVVFGGGGGGWDVVV